MRQLVSPPLAATAAAAATHPRLFSHAAGFPLSLYVHFPWCIRKCPYCDFLSYPAPCFSPLDVSADNSADNSNLTASGTPSHPCSTTASSSCETLHEANYVAALLIDLRQDLQRHGISPNTTINSIYIGGGTPTLLSSDAIEQFLVGAHRLCSISKTAEISIEANPETLTPAYCAALRTQCGINRISIGAQSFDDAKLTALGRIHNAARAHHAIEAAHTAGFKNINIDLMFGLPGQSVRETLADLRHAIALAPTHISWYQLTLEEGSAFHRLNATALRKLRLPPNDDVWRMQCAGQQLLAANSFEQYEVSAYCKPGAACQHNLNYWQFGDYLGIGAGAHGKLTLATSHTDDNRDENFAKDSAGGRYGDRDSDATNYAIIRYHKNESPQQYQKQYNDESSSHTDNSCAIFPSLSIPSAAHTVNTTIVKHQALPFEFMLNALRLYRPIPYTLFTARTGLPLAAIQHKLQQAAQLGLIELTRDNIITTTRGRNFLNDLIEIFI